MKFMFSLVASRETSEQHGGIDVSSNGCGRVGTKGEPVPVREKERTRERDYKPKRRGERRNL